MTTTTLQTLEALEIEFQDRGLTCQLSSVVDDVPVMLVIHSGGNRTICIITNDDKLQAIEYEGLDKRNADRSDIGETLLCDPHGFAAFIEMIVDKLK